MDEFGIDYSHFFLQVKVGIKILLILYIERNTFLIYANTVRWAVTNARLLSYRLGLKENKCEICGTSEWLGNPIQCELHHINGDPTDNRIENLQILCPNCHSQTDNFRSRNRTNGMRAQEETLGVEVG